MRTFLFFLGFIGFGLTIPNPPLSPIFINDTTDIDIGLTSDKPGPGDILICQGPNFTKKCNLMNYMQRCRTFDFDFFHDTSSILQLEGWGGIVSCFYWSTTKCSGMPLFAEIRSDHGRMVARDLGRNRGFVASAGCQDFAGPAKQPIISEEIGIEARSIANKDVEVAVTEKLAFEAVEITGEVENVLPAPEPVTDIDFGIDFNVTTGSTDADHPATVLFSEPGFKGTMLPCIVPPRVCVQMPRADTSSFAQLPGAECTYHSTSTCETSAQYPHLKVKNREAVVGYSHLSVIGWEDRIKSILCVAL